MKLTATCTSLALAGMLIGCSGPKETAQTVQLDPSLPSYADLVEAEETAEVITTIDSFSFVVGLPPDFRDGGVIWPQPPYEPWEIGITTFTLSDDFTLCCTIFHYPSYYFSEKAGKACIAFHEQNTQQFMAYTPFQS